MAEEKVFKIVFYHGGVLKDGDYEGGTVSILPCEEDKLSFFEIKGLIKDIGYDSGYSIICYSNAGEVLHIEDDAGVMRACIGLDNHSEVKLYLHHSPALNPFTSQAEIDEIYPRKEFELRRSPRKHKSSAPRVSEPKKALKQKLVFEGERQRQSTNITNPIVTQDVEYVIGTYPAEDTICAEAEETTGAEAGSDGDNDEQKRPEPANDEDLDVDEAYWRRVAAEIDTPSKRNRVKKAGEKHNTSLSDSQSSKAETPLKERRKKLLKLVEGLKSSDECSTPRKKSTPKKKEGRKPINSGSASEKGKGLSVDSGDEEVPDSLVNVEIDIRGNEDVESEYYDSDELRDIVDDDHKKRTDFRVLDVDENKEHIELKVGDLFANTVEFRKALQRDVIHVGYQVTYLRNEGTRITCVCSKRAEENCQWRIHASLTHDRRSFQIKTISGQHTCAKRWKNSFASADWIASTYEDVIRDNLQFDVKALRQRILREHSVEVTVGLLYKARAIMKRKLQGGYKEQYWRIRDYANMVLVKNPGSFVKIQVEQQQPDSPPVFQRIFIAYAAQLHGFKDGCYCWKSLYVEC